MIAAPKVLWGEGLFLRPQHFQRQDAYHESRLVEQSRALHPYAWGLIQCAVDVDALSHGMLRLQTLQAILPDGDQIRAPELDALPPPVSLDELPAAAGEVVFHIGLAPLRPHGGNFCAPEQAHASSVRFLQGSQAATDWFTAAQEAPVTTLARCVRLMAAGAAVDTLVHMPVLRVLRSPTGGWTLDTEFIAPSPRIAASAALQRRLRRLLEILQAKVEALYGLHREPSRHVVEFRSGDIASFWLLHTVCAAFARLSHLHHHPGLHPERLFQDLLQLAGELLTFSKQCTLSDLPVYDHRQPGASFEALDELLRELLEAVISTRCFALTLTEHKPSVQHARLDSDRITDQTRFVLGVKSALPMIELVEAVPLRFKVGAPDDVEKLVLTATSGVRLVHAPQVPSAVPVRPGWAYFLVEAQGPLYERMRQSRALALYTPNGLPDLELELFAWSA
jgi:type VI secretion system protein ImpJ